MRQANCSFPPSEVTFSHGLQLEVLVHNKAWFKVSCCGSVPSFLSLLLLQWTALV